VIYGLSGGAQPRRSASATPGLVVDRAAFAGHGDLAFVSEGRLWVLDGATGRLTALTPLSQQASDPQFSRDGRWLTFEVGTASATGSTQTWLARSDGSSPRLIARTGGVIGWLSDGRLVGASGLWRVSSGEALTRVGRTPRGLVAWSSDGSRYLFLEGGLPKQAPASSSGINRLEVASSLNGKRTTWYATPISFSPQAGLHGVVLDYAIVLPRRRGILFAEVWGASGSIIADGLDLQEIKAPGTRPKHLGVSVGDTVSLGATGTFAFTRGANRYAWMTKSVETCSVLTERCARIRAPTHTLSLDPAFSPDGRTLAFVEAPSHNRGNFGQPAVRPWYATHSLWILHTGSRTPTQIAGTSGAASPVWSADGRSLLYVANDALWLVPTISSRPVRIASPLFTPSDWPSFYGEVDWSAQFAWTSQTPRSAPLG
jgi:dipeptidyl aminopeptidase/acylaminoacyl peptidase